MTERLHFIFSPDFTLTGAAGVLKEISPEYSSEG